MRFIKIFFIIVFCIFVVSLHNSYAQEIKHDSIAVVDYKPAGKDGERFNKGMGQCVDFVKLSRPDLPWDIARDPEKPNEPGKAANMQSVAKEKGFVTNSLPREGSVLVVPEIGTDGHVAIVSKVKEIKEDGSYILTIIDANAKDEANKNKTTWSYIRERDVTINSDGNLEDKMFSKKQGNIKFIHEKKDIYDSKQKEASEYVTQVYKDLGKEPTAEEKKKYTEKLLSGVMLPEQFKNTIGGLPEPQPKPTTAKPEAIAKKPTSEDKSIKILKERVKVLKEEIKRVQTRIQSNPEAWNRVKEDFIKIGITIFNYIMKAQIPTIYIITKGILPQGLQASALNTLDASQLSQRNAQQQLTPVKVEFRQEYDLLFTQSADSLGSRYGSHSGTIDGTRFDISGDSRAGDFTGSFSGRTVAEPGYTPVTHNNTPSSGTSVGTVSAKGFKEGDLKGNMTITIPAGTQAVNVSGNITISKDGSLSMPSYTGPVTDNATSTKVGTMSGTWNQSKTTP
ncbi:MAG: CHAP domain-containing protein [Nitrospirae bacterium]|nr:CHAP domain-containing protein [Nitrospirota bacterium]